MKTTKSVFLSLLAIPTVLAHPAADPSEAKPAGSIFDFQELLAVLPAESLHAALHKHAEPRFQDGVYEHERAAVEIVHREDPSTATKVLAEAALHQLLRRQSNDTTTPTDTATTPDPPATTEDATPTTADSPPTTTNEIIQSNVIVPVEVPTTNSEGQSTTLMTSAVASPTVSLEQQVTTTNSAGNTVVETATVPGAIVTQNGVVTTSPVSIFTPSVLVDATRPRDVTTTNSRGQSVVLSSVTPGSVVTATDSGGEVFVTTYTPPGGTVSSLVLRTTRLPNGAVSTITSFAIVGAETAAASGTDGPRLQNGVGNVQPSLPAGAIAALILSFFGGAALLL